MHPDLFSIGPLTIHTYGVAMATAFLVGFWYSARRAPRERLDPEFVLDSFLPLFVGAMLGARILYIFTDLRTFLEDPVEILRIWRGGLVFYGGFLGGMAGVYIFVKIRKASFWALMDLFAPYAGISYAIHRTFGCFLGNGCCYGKPTTLPWGVLYPDLHQTRHIFDLEPVHPTQIYEAVSGIVIMAALLIYRRRPHKIGAPSALFLFIYSIFRFVIEFFRGDGIRGIWGPLSTSQWISMAMFIVGLALLARKTPVLEPLDENAAKEFVKKLSEEKPTEQKPKEEASGEPTEEHPQNHNEEPPKT